MIVTCPGCSSKYRVKNESVPTDGARMKCPKCSTMFLAKPPPAGTPEPPLEEPSSQFHQINPATPAHAAAAHPAPGHAAPPHAAPGGAASAQPPVKTAGPVTSLFGAFDTSTLPPEMQRALAQPPPPPPPSAPSGLELGSAPPRAATPAPAPAPRPLQVVPVVAPVSPTPRGPPRPAGAAHYALVGVGGAAAAFGLVFLAWTTEALPLDAMLTPLFAPVGARPITAETVTVEDLRTQARGATERGDLAGALLAWERVAARTQDDAQARTEMASLRDKLGEKQTR